MRSWRNLSSALFYSGHEFQISPAFRVRREQKRTESQIMYHIPIGAVTVHSQISAFLTNPKNTSVLYLARKVRLPLA